MKYHGGLICLPPRMYTGESSVKTAGHERTHFTCALSCTSGGRLPPIVVFKQMTMPKEKFLKEIVVKINKDRKLRETMLTERDAKRLGGFFSTGKKALLVLDSMRAHIRFCESILQED